MNFIAAIICPKGGNHLAGILNVSAFADIFEIKFLYKNLIKTRFFLIFLIALEDSCNHLDRFFSKINCFSDVFVHFSLEFLLNYPLLMTWALLTSSLYIGT
jgi:hypothetical protein